MDSLSLITDLRRRKKPASNLVYRGSRVLSHPGWTATLLFELAQLSPGLELGPMKAGPNINRQPEQPRLTPKP